MRWGNKISAKMVFLYRFYTKKMRKMEEIKIIVYEKYYNFCINQQTKKQGFYTDGKWE